MPSALTSSGNVALALPCSGISLPRAEVDQNFKDTQWHICFVTSLPTPAFISEPGQHIYFLTSHHGVWFIISRGQYFSTATGRIFCSSLGLLLTHCQSSVANHSQCFSDHIIVIAYFLWEIWIQCIAGGRLRGGGDGVKACLHFYSCSASRLSPFNLQMWLTRDLDVSLTLFLCMRAGTDLFRKFYKPRTSCSTESRLGLTFGGVQIPEVSLRRSSLPHTKV